jgi:sugar phosphate isomerase/epimerase
VRLAHAPASGVSSCRDRHATYHACRHIRGRRRPGAARPPAELETAARRADAVLGSNLEFVKAEGFTSAQLRLNPDQLDDAAIAAIKDNIAKSGIYISALAVDGNHIDPDPAKRERQNAYTLKCLDLCGKLGIPNIGGQSGTIPNMELKQQVDEIVKVYTERYFSSCEKNKVRILWEPYAGGPNIATGPVGWEALFKAFQDSPHVGLQFDPSHLVWQFMDPVAAAREFADKIYDVHLKDTEILWHVLKRGGIQPVNHAHWWRFRLPGYGSMDWKGFFTVLSEVGYTGAMNIENEDEFYYPAYRGATSRNSTSAVSAWRTNSSRPWCRRQRHNT